MHFPSKYDFIKTDANPFLSYAYSTINHFFCMMVNFVSHTGSKVDWVYLKENTTRRIIGYKGEEVPTELDGTVQQIHDYEVTE